MTQPPQHQEPPGFQAKMEPCPDCGEDSYQGHGRLQGKAAVITGADSGIGRAVAIAYAREGADVLISYLNEHEDAEDTPGTSRRPGGGPSSSPATYPNPSTAATSSRRRSRSSAASTYS
jgi:hypothetical protein